MTDPATVATMAQRWAGEGWPCEVDASGIALTAEFSAPSAGPPPWFVYKVTPRHNALLTVVQAARPAGRSKDQLSG